MYLFTSESVSAGHPDKCADIISDSIVDRYLQEDPDAKVAAEVLIAGNNVTIAGEVASTVKLYQADYEKIVINALIAIGYTGQTGFTREQTLYPDDIRVTVQINRQSDEIRLGVLKQDGEIGAGDQGIMFGYACNETESFMPSAIEYSRQICNTVYEYALRNPNELGVDIKTQVTIDYGSKDGFFEGKPQRIHTIVVSAPYTEALGWEKAEWTILKLIKESGLPKELFNPENCNFKINYTGSYIRHSALYDSGLTGRKLIVDSYGGYAPIGGGAQSGKDYSKVDRSGLYAARWIAKHIVASGIASKALVQISYVIGQIEPVNITVDTSNTNTIAISDEELSKRISEEYSLTPLWIRNAFQLQYPSEGYFLYADVAARGQVGIEDYPWEKIEALDFYTQLIEKYKPIQKMSYKRLKLKNTAIYGFQSEEQFNRLKKQIQWPSNEPYGTYEMVYTNELDEEYLFSLGGRESLLPCGWQKIHANTLESLLNFN